MLLVMTSKSSGISGCATNRAGPVKRFVAAGALEEIGVAEALPAVTAFDMPATGRGAPPDVVVFG